MKIKKNKKKVYSFGKLRLSPFSWSHWSHLKKVYRAINLERNYIEYLYRFMSGTYLQNKKSIYNWREKNKDKWNEYRRNLWKQNSIWKKISREFMNILLD